MQPNGRVEAKIVGGDRSGRAFGPPIRLSLFRERLAWGVPQRATLLTPQQDAVKHAAREISNDKQAPAMPVRLFTRQIKTQNRFNVSHFQLLTVVQ
ncbi:MAG: hypothetical protein DME45_06285 [Verrucomicrobia bacterium]|nr:MAG: hypothetical protein DME45_06285 [Verrucomicrobiota bacterium]